MDTWWSHAVVAAGPSLVVALVLAGVDVAVVNVLFCSVHWCCQFIMPDVTTMYRQALIAMIRLLQYNKCMHHSLDGW